MPRKYRQRGYMDYDSNADNQKRGNQQRERQEYDGPRGRSASPMFKVFHCSRCGETIPEVTQFEFDAKCSNCSADLHCCMNCKFFDPGNRYECMKPIEEAIPRKDIANKCTVFAPKLTWTHPTGQRSLTADEARKVLDNLFKK